jgi:hypothetical protein
MLLLPALFLLGILYLSTGRSHRLDSDGPARAANPARSRAGAVGHKAWGKVGTE